jgi:hypothetical protein
MMVVNSVLGQKISGGRSLTPYEQGYGQGLSAVTMLAYLVGAILALIALRAMKTQGPAGIRGWAWTGLAVNVILLAMLVGAVLAMIAMPS